MEAYSKEVQVRVDHSSSPLQTQFESLDAQCRRRIHYLVYRVYIKVHYRLVYDFRSFSVSTASTVGE
jgi:hypothetical protein